MARQSLALFWDQEGELGSLIDIGGIVEVAVNKKTAKKGARVFLPVNLKIISRVRKPALLFNV